jgi:hypothetical protein
MPKDYQESLRKMTHKASIYIAKYRSGLHKYMTAEQIDALKAFEEASHHLQEVLGPTPYNDKTEQIEKLRNRSKLD